MQVILPTTIGFYAGPIVYGGYDAVKSVTALRHLVKAGRQEPSEPSWHAFKWGLQGAAEGGFWSRTGGVQP
jgi:hypothetical protein